jgi:hypothetical protein
MAQISYVNQVLAGFPTDQRKALQLAFEYVLTNLRLGQPDPSSRAENLQLYYFDGVTAATANTEFTIVHGLAAVPYNMIQVLPLRIVGAQIVPLRVTRRCDANRIYLSSSVINAPFMIALEV